ncbi:MAG: ABC transporter permease [Candidatus Eremiobacteraeota bacterium]|nr:ABC transporter permease [Candidatus Eremiobacteraeota bacterium]MBC5827591.1 ABC transporter permease [Candidatus Eremiobacteraeota bacterium]
MTPLLAVFPYASSHRSDLWIAIRTHLALSGAALGIGTAIGVAAGIFSAHNRFGPWVVALMNAARVVPSLAVLTFMLPLLGLGFAPSLVALALLACPPVLINTDLGFRGVDAAIKEAAVGMGMRPLDVLRRIETPIALPVVIAGVRTAAVEVIASATLATFIGGGGLGDFIVRGLQNDDAASLVLGAGCVAALALMAEGLLSALQRATVAA